LVTVFRWLDNVRRSEHVSKAYFDVGVAPSVIASPPKIRRCPHGSRRDCRDRRARFFGACRERPFLDRFVRLVLPNPLTESRSPGVGEGVGGGGLGLWLLYGIWLGEGEKDFLVLLCILFFLF